MASEQHDEKSRVRYLLGDLPAEEEARIEDRAFADRDYMGALDAAEADLIDAYVRGELSHAERRRFENRFLTSPQRRRKVEFARNLARIADATASAVASLVLLPGLSRAETNRAQLPLKPSAQLARIEILLEPRDDFPRFTAELRTDRGDEVLARSNLSRRRTAAGYVVAFDVPTSALETAEYELTLKGVTSDGRAQDLGFYYFSVDKS